MSHDAGNRYSYIDPKSGEKVIVAGEDHHNDRFAVLYRQDADGAWEFDAAHQLRRTAELAIEHRGGQREGSEFIIVDLSPEEVGDSQ